MRLRNIPGADDVIASSAYCVQYPDNFRGSWSHVFDNANPIHIEVGMGKGQFLLELASRNPNVNYIGIEKYTSVLLRAIQKLEQMNLTDIPTNIKFICMNAENLTEVFAPDEIERIYLNFSDPWPKDRHARRRLTSTEYLNRYSQILKPFGQLEFKTDNRIFFDFSMNEIPAAGWRIDAYTYDLHSNESMNEGNIMTEYEEKFSSMGNPICKLIASRSAKP